MLISYYEVWSYGKAMCGKLSFKSFSSVKFVAVFDFADASTNGKLPTSLYFQAMVVNLCLSP